MLIACFIGDHGMVCDTTLTKPYELLHLMEYELLKIPYRVSSPISSLTTKIISESQICFRTSTRSSLKSFRMSNHLVVAHLLAPELLTVPLYSYDYIMLFWRFL